METIIGRPIPNKFDLRFSGNLSPERAAILWQPIFEMMVSLSIQLDGAFSRSRISTEGVDATVPKFVGVIESLKDVHGDRFSKFAANVAAP